MGRNRGSKNVTTEQKEKIIDMVNAGMKQSKVASFYSLPRDTVKSIIRCCKTDSISVSLTKDENKTQTRTSLSPQIIELCTVIRYWIKVSYS